MKDSIRHRLILLDERFDEIAGLLADPNIIFDQNKYRDLSKEYSQLDEIVNQFRRYQILQEQSSKVKEMLKDEDTEIHQLAKDEFNSVREETEVLEHELQLLLVPNDSDDNCNVYLEIRAGTGGDEAAIFSGDLHRMYLRYAESMKWTTEIISESLSEQGGYKEVITKILGNSVFAYLKFESGAHRVQRVPATESQGRIHTSACTVAVLPEVESVEEMPIEMKDLRIDTFRASGAGGQHVNKTDSAIRLTHIPSGIVVECQEKRSQHKNKAKAMALLQAKLLLVERTKQEEEQAETRRTLVGSGDRSERIRTYNYPQGRITDHRINLTLYKLDEIVEGDLSQVIDPLVREYKAEQLAFL